MCFDLWYYVYGLIVGTLSVKIKVYCLDPSKSQFVNDYEYVSTRQIWNSVDVNSTKWNRLRMTIMLSGQTFVAKAYQVYSKNTNIIRNILTNE